MDIRIKTFLIISITILTGIFVISLFSYTYLTDSYTDLEKRNIEEIFDKELLTLSNEETYLKSSVGDWARWDETYYYIKDKNEGYETKNLNFESVNNLNIDFIIYVQNDQTVIQAIKVNSSKKDLDPIPDDIVWQMISIPGFLNFASILDYHSGYIILPYGPVMMVSTPIITSTYKGPSDGYLIMGKILDPETTEKITVDSDLNVTLVAISSETLKSLNLLQDNLSTFDNRIFISSKGFISCSRLIPTLNSEGVLEYTITRHTNLINQGKNTIDTFILFQLILGIIIIIISFISVDFLVLKRIKRIINRVKERYHDYNEENLKKHSDDEFSELERVIHPVILELNRSNEQLEQKIKQVSESENRYREIADSQCKLADIVEHSSSGIVTGIGESVDYVNLSYARMHGMNRNELIGRDPFFVVKDLSSKAFLYYLQNAFHSGHVTFEKDHLKKDGLSFPALHELTVLSGEVPENSIWTMNVHDITENKLAWKALLDSEALRESARQLRDVISRLPDATFVIDKDGWVIFWNQAMEVLTGISGDEIIGRGKYEYSYPFYGEKRPMLLNMILEKDRNFFDLYRGASKKDDSLVIEESFPKMGKGGKYFSTMASPLYDSRGNVIGAIQSMRDMTPRIMAEQALMKTNKKLHLLSGITRHDIRNKITVLQGLLPIIQQFSDKPDDTEIIRIFSTAINSINEQIEFTRVYQDLGVQSPVWQSLSTLIKKASKIGIPDYISISESLHGIEVYSDPLLERVFYNLIDNSMRHGGEKVSKISFTYRNEGDLLIVIYEDDGIGIPLENKEIIFTRGYGNNTGLGLFLVREILSITGISIIENGGYEQGARFEITIPYGFYSVNDKIEDKNERPDRNSNPSRRRDRPT